MLCERPFGSAQEDTNSHLNGRLTPTLTWGLREADQLWLVQTSVRQVGQFPPVAKHHGIAM